jgi:putative PEP-CTERM system histidine kinase
VALRGLPDSGGPILLGEADAVSEAVVHPDLRSGAAIVPMRRADDVIGFLLLGLERTGAPYSLDDLEFLSTVAEQAAVAVTTVRLSQSLAQARQFEAFHRLTSFVVHDLKNSISALSMLSTNALRHFDDPEFQRDAITTLARTVDRMKQLLGRLSAGAATPDLVVRPVDLAGLVLEATLPLSNEPRIALVKDLAPLRAVLGDAEALLRVVQNLVTNALQSIEAKGTVTLATYEEDAMGCLAVTDTGSGMSAEFIRDSLFTPFHSTKPGGWGLGLYQVKTIIERHGGMISVTSTPGHGTTFIVRLPLQDTDAGGATR